MLKILQARFQQYVNHELPDIHAGFRKGRRARDQIANTHYIIEKERDKWTYLHSRNRLTDIENKGMVTKGETWERGVN